jgi:hypothetical protein
VLRLTTHILRLCLLLRLLLLLVMVVVRKGVMVVALDYPVLRMYMWMRL